MASDKTEVVIVTDGLFPVSVGGMQRHSRLLVEALADTGQVSLTVFHPHGGDRILDIPGVMEKGLQADNFLSKALGGIRGAGYLLRAYAYSINVFQALRDHPNAVVYSQGLSVWHGISRLGQPVAVNPHGLEPFQALSLREKLYTGPLRLAHHYVFRYARRVISLGGRLTDILARRCGVGTDRLVVIPNAVPETASIPVRQHHEGRASFLFVSRFARNKGIPYLAEAIRELNAAGYGDRMTFHLAGSGALLDWTRNHCKAENVHIHGRVDDDKLRELYRTCDMFVLPTLFEGMPTVVLEAMNTGMPVMVTDTGATREQVDDTNGYIIEKKSARAIREAAIRFLETPPAKRSEMSNASLDKIRKRFTWKAVAQRHIELFSEMSRSHD